MSRSRAIPLRIGLLLRQAHQRAARALNDALAPLQLTGRHFGVLMLIDRDGVSTQRDLIRQTGSDKAGMVRTVEDLESLGYLTRTRSAGDKRVFELRLTDHGQQTFAEASRLAGQTGDDLFAAFTDDELDTLGCLLARFVAEE